MIVKPKVIALFHKGNKILVGKAIDKVTGEIYYRPLGGSIEFGEKSIDALKREIDEETGKEIKNIAFVSLLENMFICDGQPGHEILLVYKAEFKDISIYDIDEIRDCGAITEGWLSVLWKDINDFINGDILYPDGLLNLLNIKD